MPEFLTAAELNCEDSLYNKIISDALEKRILIVNQIIDDQIVEDFIMHIINWNIEDRDIPTDKRKHITLIINSAGGDVVVGMGLIDVIKTSKTPVVAIGVGLIASMSLHIFISAFERYAFPNTVLLMHDGEVNISNSGSKAKDTVRFIDELESRVKNHVIACTKVDEEFYDNHYSNEYYMYADKQGKELGFVDKIIGIDIDLDEII